MALLMRSVNDATAPLCTGFMVGQSVPALGQSVPLSTSPSVGVGLGRAISPIPCYHDYYPRYHDYRVGVATRVDRDRAGRRASRVRHPCYSVRRAGASRVVQGGRGCADGDVSPPPPSPISTFFIFGVAGTAACVPTSADATRQVVDGWEVAGLDRDVGVWYSIVDLQGCALRPTRAIRLSGAPETLMCRSDQTGHRSRFPIHLGGSPASGWNGGYNDSEGQGEE